MSDSEDGSSVPSDATIERALRSTVAALFANDDLENLTVKRVRKSVEQQLNLPEDYLKTNTHWAEKSKDVITAESDAQEAGPGKAASSPAKKPAPKKAASKPKASQKASVPAPKQPAKRKQDPKPKPRKRRKTVSSDDDEDDDGDHKMADAEMSSDVEPPKKVVSSNSNRGRKGRALPESDDEEDEDEDTKPAAAAKSSESEAQSEPPEKATNDVTNAEDSDSSELSVLIDEPPPKKKRGPKKGAVEKPAKKETKSKPKAAKAAQAEKDMSPDEAEIKRLQGWLLKCGIRRLWGKELAQFDTSKAKINHLRDLLKEIGMDGRYSVEKARQIKERRELAAELDAVQEGAKRWGQEEESDQADEGKPRRRLARGLQEFQFLDSSGEDSD